MAIVDLAAAEQRAELALIRAAGEILRSGNSAVPEDFISDLFGYAAPEDLLRYDARRLAELAAAAWSCLALRKPGQPKIRLQPPEQASGGRASSAETVLEIVNDEWAKVRLIEVPGGDPCAEELCHATDIIEVV